MEANNQPTVEDLLYFKNEAAREINLLNWSDALFGVTNEIISWQVLDATITKAADRYAAHLVQQAKDAAFKEGYRKGLLETYSVDKYNDPQSPYKTGEKYTANCAPCSGCGCPYPEDRCIVRHHDFESGKKGGE
jgi:hypothetical protein